MPVNRWVTVRPVAAVAVAEEPVVGDDPALGIAAARPEGRASGPDRPLTDERGAGPAWPAARTCRRRCSTPPGGRSARRRCPRSTPRLPEPPMAGPKVVMHRSAISSPELSIQASPSGSVTISACSWLIVDSVGSAVLPLGRGLLDWQWPGDRVVRDHRVVDQVVVGVAVVAAVAADAAPERAAAGGQSLGAAAQPLGRDQEVHVALGRRADGGREPRARSRPGAGCRSGTPSSPGPVAGRLRAPVVGESVGVQDAPPYRES